MQQPPNYPNYGGWQQPLWPSQPPPSNTYYPPKSPPFQQEPWQPLQLPMIPLQAPLPRPPKKKRNRWLILGIIFGALLLFGAIANAVTKSSPSPQVTPTTDTDQATKTPVPTATLDTSIPTDTPLPRLQATEVPAFNHGRPHIGGLMSDFYGKYGTPNEQGTGMSETWVVQSILINATPEHGKVTGIGVIGSPDWSNQQTKAYCLQFLPGDAQQFKVDGTYTNYQSSVGEIAMQLPGHEYCVLTLAQQ